MFLTCEAMHKVDKQNQNEMAFDPSLGDLQAFFQTGFYWCSLTKVGIWLEFVLWNFLMYFLCATLSAWPESVNPLFSYLKEYKKRYEEWG